MRRPSQVVSSADRLRRNVRYRVVMLSAWTLVLVLFGVGTASFGAGYLLSHKFFLIHANGPTVWMWTTKTKSPSSIAAEELSTPREKTNLPELPTETEETRDPNTSKQFETSHCALGNSLECASDMQDGTCADETAQKRHHLLFDIKNLDPVFLRSEERISAALLDLARSSLSTPFPLSYHCRSLEITGGVSCVGICSESAAHVSLYTWPLGGVVSFDLFTHGSYSLLSLLPTVKDLFGVPSPSTENIRNMNQLAAEPSMVWSQKMRGFLGLQGADIHGILGSSDQWDRITTVQTKFQRIDIYDVVEQPQFGSSRDRVVFLDGSLQSRRYGKAAYHEALVHPALFTHDNPRRVIILGGGTGATLCEVLKHNTVQEVVVVEHDHGLLNVARQYLPDWSDCSNLIGRVDSCFDDPRITVHCRNVVTWFMEMFGANATVTESDRFDVLIVDALYVLSLL